MCALHLSVVVQISIHHVSEFKSHIFRPTTRCFKIAYCECFLSAFINSTLTSFPTEFKSFLLILWFLKVSCSDEKTSTSTVSELTCPFLCTLLFWPRSQPENTYCYESECLASSRALGCHSVRSCLCFSPQPTRGNSWSLYPCSGTFSLFSPSHVGVSAGQNLWFNSLPRATSVRVWGKEGLLESARPRSQLWFLPSPTQALLCRLLCCKLLWVGRTVGFAAIQDVSWVLSGCLVQSTPGGWKSVYGTHRIHEAGEHGASLLSSWMFFFPSSIQSDTSRLDRDQASDEKHI